MLPDGTPIVPADGATSNGLAFDVYAIPSDSTSNDLTTVMLPGNHFVIEFSTANFQMMRRTHSTLLYELDVDPQVRADQMGHTVDVNQNQYTRSSLERRRNAVNALEKALGVA